MSPLRMAFAALVALVVALSVGACSEVGGGEVASLRGEGTASSVEPDTPVDDGGTSETSEPAGPGQSADTTPTPQAVDPETGVAGQRAGVEAFVACLVEAGLPAEVSDSGDGQGFVAWGEGVEVWVGDPEGRIWAASMVGKSVAAERPVGGFDQVAAMTVANPGRWVALVDGTDRSEEYGTCREAYPYTEPTAAPVDPAQELAAKERMVEASNRWAACVRENGFPGVADVPRAVADNWDTTPMVLLPTWIEEAALRALMKVWPEFDRAVEGAYHEAMMSGRTDVEYPGAPSIGFDVPGYDGTEAESDLPAEEVERLEGLMAIVRAERGEFFSSLGGVGSGSQTWALRHPRHRALLELSSDFALSLVRAPLG